MVHGVWWSANGPRLVADAAELDLPKLYAEELRRQLSVTERHNVFWVFTLPTQPGLGKPYYPWAELWKHAVADARVSCSLRSLRVAMFSVFLPALCWYSLAAFLITRGPYAWFGYGWTGCADHNHPFTRPKELDVDYGIPLGLLLP